MEEVKPGISLELAQEITPDQSAARVGSGALDVFSTPSMIGLMEKTSMKCIEPFLEESESTVGGAVNVRHYMPTAIGKRVTCKSEVISVKGRKIDFKVETFEDGKLIGDGNHVRFVVDKNDFMNKI
ncbi:MAG: thioesterase family protein [Cytophagales bacterium]|nr:thioesterase family protein [Cytophagales bacterium]